MLTLIIEMRLEVPVHLPSIINDYDSNKCRKDNNWQQGDLPANHNETLIHS
jgi:hypothetical protein